MEFTEDFGSGYKGYFVPWQPDRELNPQYADLPDLEKAILILSCPHKPNEHAGGVALHPAEYDVAFKGPRWDVISWEPLTINPSILMNDCGCHGYIRNGEWESC
jgi:hypothetical protein